MQTTTEQERIAISMADADSTLSRMTLYCAVAGATNTPFPSHIYAVIVEDADDLQLWSNLETSPEVEAGNNSLGFHKGALEWLRYQYDTVVGSGVPRTLTIIAPKGSELERVYKQPAEELLRRRFKKSDGKFYANRSWIAQTLAEAEERSVTVHAREPESNHEHEMLATVQEAARSRWLDACEALESKFG